MSDDVWKVIRADGKALFRGAEADARRYVEDNFPRRHVEPGNDYGEDGPPHDVTVQAPDGAVHKLNAPGDWSSDRDTTDETTETGTSVVPVLDAEGGEHDA